MVKRSRKIGKIVALARAEERRQGALTGRSRAELNSQLERLSELSAYRQNYAGSKKGVNMIGSAHLKDYQNFLHRLDSAVRTQRHVVQDNEQAVEVHRRRWMSERQRLESLQNVLERYERNEYLQGERDEQRKLDDLHAKPEQYDDEGS